MNANRVAIPVAIWCAMHVCNAQPAEVLLSGKVKCSRFVMPVYSEKEDAPAVVLRVENIFTEHEKRGFYRIGLLPVVVLDGVTVEAREPQPLGKSLASLNDALDRRDRRMPVEVRRLKIVFPESLHSTIDVDAAHQGKHGEWILRQVVLGRNATKETIPQAQLRLSNADEIILETVDGQRVETLISEQIEQEQPALQKD